MRARWRSVTSCVSSPANAAGLAGASLTCVLASAAAAAALGALPEIAGRYPQAAGWGLAVAEAFLAGPDEIAIVGPGSDERTRTLHMAAAVAATPGAVIALGPGVAAMSPAGTARATDLATGDEIPLLEGRGLVNGQPAAYVCRGFSCRFPVTTAHDLAELLRR